ncbi:TPA: hypothetical protein U1234_001507 [Streptococcus suis]|nr:hypothetical protein [Streptococcus suis]
MTNEKLGVLLVDVPEPKSWEYSFVAVDTDGHFAICGGIIVDDVVRYAYKFTQEEAQKYSQFRWVALEELE